MKIKQHLVLDDDSNIIWSGWDAPTKAVMKLLTTMLPEANFSTYAVDHVVFMEFKPSPCPS